MNLSKAELARAASFGIAARIPGLQDAIDTLESYLNELRAHLSEMQAAEARGPRKEKRRQGWPESAAARRREMARRLAARKPKKKKLPISDPEHPGHKAWLKKIKAAGRKRWRDMSPAQREDWQRKISAGKKAA